MRVVTIVAVIGLVGGWATSAQAHEVGDPASRAAAEDDRADAASGPGWSDVGWAAGLGAAGFAGGAVVGLPVAAGLLALGVAVGGAVGPWVVLAGVVAPVLVAGVGTVVTVVAGGKVLFDWKGLWLATTAGAALGGALCAGLAGSGLGYLAAAVYLLYGLTAVKPPGVSLAYAAPVPVMAALVVVPAALSGAAGAAAAAAGVGALWVE